MKYRIRLIGGVADGGVWEGDCEPPATMERIGRAATDSIFDATKPPEIDQTPRSVYIRVPIRGQSTDIYYVYVDSLIPNVSKALEMLLQNYCPLNSRFP